MTFKLKSPILIIILILSGNQFSFADYNWITPNELYPIVESPILERTNHGAYISVGTERSFAGAAVAKAEALYVFDIDPNIVKFAKINTILISISTNREDYVRLRFAEKSSAWTSRSEALSKSDFDFWQTYVNPTQAFNTGTIAFEFLMNAPQTESQPYFGFNYLFDDHLFSHLKKLAKERKIFWRVGDLTKGEDVKSLIADVHARGFKMGIVDTSNVWSYVSLEATAEYLMNFVESCDSGSIFVFTAHNSYRMSYGTNVFWSYHAWTCEKLKGHSVEEFAEQMESVLKDPVKWPLKATLNQEVLQIWPNKNSK